MESNLHGLTEELKSTALEMGFVLAGVVAAAEPKRLEHFNRWLENGYAGQMQYLEQRKSAYSHPRHVLDGCKSILMLGLPYPSDKPEAKNPDDEKTEHAKVARYAANLDYHDIIHAKLKTLQAWLLEKAPDAVARGIVDTAPLLEREFAEAAGLGWVGKNTLLLNKTWGSYFFLAALLTDIDLKSDAAFDGGHCGTCMACLSACPTDAFPEPYVLNAEKCISYLTIEHRDHIDPMLAEKFSGWGFGCDICQEVCPWNRKLPEHTHTRELVSDDFDIDILETLRMNDEAFRARYRKTPIWRSKRRGIIRNAILVAGQRKLDAAGDVLLRLLEDQEPLVRAAAGWAVTQIRPEGWQTAISRAIELEKDKETQCYLRQTLEETV